MKKEKTVENLLNHLIAVETMGNVNYSTMALINTEPRMKEFFSILSQQEEKHKALYEKIKKRTCWV